MSQQQDKELASQQEQAENIQKNVSQKNEVHSHNSLDDIQDTPKSKELTPRSREFVDEENKDSDLASGKEKKPSSPEFNSLKDIDGNIIRHESNVEEEPEDPNQKVHFKIEANEEIEEPTEEPESPARANLNKKPRKSILKKSLIFSQGGGETGTPKGVDNISEDFAREKPIKDSIEFLSVWKDIKHDLTDVEKFFQDQAKPMDFTSIFSHGIEIELLSEIIAITNELAHINSRLALDVLESLTEVKDFENVSKELSDKQKIDIHTIFVKLRTSLNLHEDSVSSVSNKYLA